MIVNPDRLKPREKPYFHQISMDCLEKLVDCIKRFNNDEIDADTSCKIEKPEIGSAIINSVPDIQEVYS